MFLDRILHRQRVINLDDPALLVLRGRLFSGELREKPLKFVAGIVLRLVLKQSMRDQAIALHIFLDEQDDCIRLSLYQPVDEEYRELEWIDGDWRLGDTEGGAMDEKDEIPDFVEFMDAEAERLTRKIVDRDSAHRAWVQMFPVPANLGWSLFKHIRRYAGMTARDSVGKLRLCSHGDISECIVSASGFDDFRVYFGDERPPIRPKTPEQIGEEPENVSGRFS